MLKNISNYFKSISSEMKKVSWMNKQQIINSTIIAGQKPDPDAPAGSIKTNS